MAGKKRGSDIDFGDIDLDSELDLPGFSDKGFDLGNDRKAIGHFKAALGSGLKSKFQDKSFLRRLVGIAAPKGYSQAFNAYDGIKRGIGDIYKDNQSELQPYLIKSGRALERNAPRVFRSLPRSMREMFKEADAKQSTSQQSELDENLGAIDKLFQLNVSDLKNKKVKEATDDLLKKRQFEIQMTAAEQQARLINRLVSYQDTILINYHRKTLELGYRHYDVAVRNLAENRAFHEKSLEFLASIGKNSSLPDYVKMNTDEAIKEGLRRKLIDSMSGGIGGWTGSYFGNLKTKVSQTIGGVASGLSLASSMGGGAGMSKSAMLGMGLGTAASEMVGAKLTPAMEYLVSLVAPAIEKTPGIQASGNFLRKWLTSPAQQLNRWASSTTTQEGLSGEFIDMLKNFVDRYDSSTKIQGTGHESLGDVAKFDINYYKTVTEIMPAYMASMDKSLRELVTGQPQEEFAFSHYTGGMVTRSTLNKQNIRVAVKQSQGDNIRREVDSLMQEMGASELTPQAKRVLRRRLLTDLQSGNNFDPKDYVLTNSWPEADESVGDELIEFFADTFALDMEGRFTGNQDDLTRTQDVNQVFTDISKRLPNARQRMAVLSSVLGRRTFRESGLTRYDGVEGDTIDVDAFNRMLLGDDDDDELRAAITRRLSKIDPKDLKGSMANRAKEKKSFAQKAIEEAMELERSNAMAGMSDDVDVTSRGGYAVSKFSSPGLGGTQPTPETAASRGKPDRYNFKLRDQGTHQRLDKIIELLGRNNPSGGGGGSEGPSSPGGNPLLDGIAQRAGEFYNTHKGKVTDLKNQAVGKYRQAEQYLKKHPRVKKGLQYIENIHGKITDPELRASIIQAIYARSGTPEEISKKVKTQLDRLKDSALGYKDQAGNWIKDKTSPAAKERYQQYVTDGLDQFHDMKDSGIAWAKDKTSTTARAGYKKEAQELAEKLLTFMGSNFNKGRKAASEFSGLGGSDAIAVRDEELYKHIERLAEIGMAQGTLLEGLVGSSNGNGAPSENNSFFGKLRKSLWSGTKGGFSGVATAAKWYAGKAMSFYKGIGSIAGSAVGLGVSGVKGLFTSRDGLGVTDVYVSGNTEPSLSARAIRSGYYKDVITDKTVHAFKDIKGPVIDIRTDEMVITEEDFDKGLYKANGESLAGYLGRKAGALGKMLGTGAAAYVGGTYGMMFKAIKAISNIAIDQFTQYDAYFPGDDSPRIRSNLMKKHYYRNEAGEPISSLDEIKGPVFDPDGNEVISQDELDKYKSLYSRNGSLLFTAGRGAVSAGKFMGAAALKFGKAYAKGVIGMYKMAGRTFMKGMRRLGRMFSRKGGGSSAPISGDFGSLEEVTMAAFEVNVEQLKVQQAILNQLSGGESDHMDADGDGIRENSWADRARKRLGLAPKATGKEAGSAAVVAAITQLGKKIDKNFGNLEDAVEDAGGGGGGIMGGIGDFFGGRGKGRMGRIGGKIGAAAKWLGRGLKSRLGFAATRLLMPAAIGLGKVALAAGSALVTAVGAPVLIGAAVVGGLAYVGYRAYRNSKIKDKPLYHLRMTQYGVSPTDEGRVELMLALEALVRPGIIGADTESPSLDPNKFAVAKIDEMFGITDEESEEMILRKRNLYAWLGFRFKPAYLAHCKAMIRMANTVDLSQADERIKGAQLKDVLSLVLVPGLDKMYDRDEISPFDGDLSEDKGDVDKIVDIINDLIKDAPKDKDPTKELKGNALTESAKSKVVLSATAVGATDVTKLTEEYTRKARAANFRTHGAANHASQYVAPANRKQTLNLSSAVRYHSYGLVELTLDKVEDLYKIEESLWDKLEFDGTKSASLTGSLDDHLESVQTIFKAIALEQKANVELWFKHRFLPVFFQYAIGVRRNFNGPVQLANEKVSGDALKAILRGAAEVTTSLDGQTKDIWSIQFSPWLGYVLANDPGIITQYLDSIKTTATGPLTVEGLDKAKDKGTTRNEDYQKFIMGKATGSKLDSQGRQTQTGSILANMQRKTAGVSGAPLLTQGVGATGAGAGVRVPHPGGGTGGDINALPDSLGSGASANRDLIHAAAKMVGFDPEIAMTIAGVESSWNPQAGAGTSSAKGLFQFIGSTWTDMMKRHASKYGINPNTSPFDPKANAIMGALYLKENYASIKNNNPDAEVTDLSLYMAHFLGAGGAAKWLRQHPSTPSSQGVYSIDQFNANQAVFRDKSGRELSVGEVNAKFENRLAQIRKLAGSRSTTATGKPGDVATDLPAVTTVTDPDTMPAAGPIGVMAPKAPESTSSGATPPPPVPQGPIALPIAPSTTSVIAARQQQAQSQQSTEKLGDIGTILSRSHARLESIDKTLMDIKRLMQTTSASGPQTTAGNPAQPQQTAQSATSSARPMPRQTSGNQREGAI